MFNCRWNENCTNRNFAKVYNKNIMPSCLEISSRNKKYQFIGVYIKKLLISAVHKYIINGKNK